MLAVGEAAGRGDRLDVGEHGRQPGRLLPDARELEPGGVDHDAAAGQRHELPPGRGVAPAIVGLADGGRRPVAAGEAVEQRGLADAGGAEALVCLSPSPILDADPVGAGGAEGPSRAALIAGGANVLPARPSTARASTPSAVDARAWGVTGVLLGASGVGKTSLLNRLAGGDRATAPIREADDRGRHTTTWRELVPLAGGGVVIDTPGLKLPRIWEQAAGLSAVFADVEAIAATCRFADCKHAGEPGCAVAEALADGRLTQERVAALEQLRREQAWADTRRDHRLRRETQGGQAPQAARAAADVEGEAGLARANVDDVGLTLTAARRRQVRTQTRRTDDSAGTFVVERRQRLTNDRAAAASEATTSSLRERSE